MESNIFVPKKINVGFQNREDTYTKKLAYVIYFDEKGKLRKKTSWDNWRDKEIDNIIYDNEPTEGFVLNKHVGGYCSGWEHRNSYIRVYDPRKFEFEISVENLLYILENCNSIKGKGLEGNFVYGWDGKDLVLIPTASPDYVEISKYNKIIHANTHIKTKDLKLGATYRTKQNEEWIYMGRFDYYKDTYERIPDGIGSYGMTKYKNIIKNINKGKCHYFARECRYSWVGDLQFETLILKNLGNKFILAVSTDCVENYAELFDKLEHQSSYSPYDKEKDEYIRYTFEEFNEKLTDYKCWSYFFDSQRKEVYIHKLCDNPLQYGCLDRNYCCSEIKGTLEEIYNEIEPAYKNEYLKNGKLYRRIN
ncbi:hypothetical protein ACFHWD_03200 [Clostridium sp. MT-14]|uniref:hypothetical protein n=1 Tax=Clostridium sp. MT-14 TaxID=3348360 RepID=UPI0035F2407A